jgi:hypothetical protein
VFSFASTSLLSTARVMSASNPAAPVLSYGFSAEGPVHAHAPGLSTSPTDINGGRPAITENAAMVKHAAIVKAHDCWLALKETDDKAAHQAQVDVEAALAA